MLRIELEFDTTLPKETVNKYCKETDRLFAEEGIKCIETAFAKRVYADDNVLIEDLLSPLMDIRENRGLTMSIISATLSNDDEKIDLIKDCFRLEVK